MILILHQRHEPKIHVQLHMAMKKARAPNTCRRRGIPAFCANSPYSGVEPLTKRGRKFETKYLAPQIGLEIITHALTGKAKALWSRSFAPPWASVNRLTRKFRNFYWGPECVFQLLRQEVSNSGAIHVDLLCPRCLTATL